MEPDRLVELYVALGAASSGGTRGSGCLIGVGLILTAAHVVGPLGSECLWRRLKIDGTRAVPTAFQRAHVVWADAQLDGALVRVLQGVDDSAATQPLLRMGELAMGEWFEVALAGFPELASADSHTDVEVRQARMNAGSRLRAGRAVLQVVGPMPIRKAGWGGMSGGPVMAGDVLVGVVSLASGSTEANSLEALPLARLVEDRAAAAVLQGAGLVLPLSVVTARYAAALPASGSWTLLRARYRESVLATFCTLTRAGLSVAQALAAPSVSQGFLSLRLAPKVSDGVPIDVAGLADLPRAVLTGETGAGKSTALKQALIHAATSHGLLPLWLPLSELPAEGTLTARVLLDALVTQAHRQLLLEEVNSAFFEAALADGAQAVVAFDALDEAGPRARRDQVREAVQAFSLSWPHVSLWLSSRPAAYEESPLQAAPEAPQWQQLSVAPLDTADMLLFLRQACGDDGHLAVALAQRPDLRPLMHTPLTLAMLASMAASENGLPANARGAFANWVEMMCVHWEQAKGQRANDDALRLRLDALRAIGWAAQCRGEPAAPFPRHLALKAVAPLFGVRANAARDALLQVLIQRTGLLTVGGGAMVATSDSMLSFSHLQIQEYLAGADAARRFADEPAGVLEELQGLWYLDEWREPLGFMAAELVTLGGLHHALLKAVHALESNFEDLLFRRTLMLGSLLTKVPSADASLLAQVVQMLCHMIDERQYKFDVACESLVDMGHHPLARVPLRRLAEGRALTPDRGGSGDFPRLRLPGLLRLRAAEMVASAEGPLVGLALLNCIEPEVELSTLLDCLKLRAKWGDANAAEARLAEIFISQDLKDLRGRREVDLTLQSIGRAARADALIDALLQDSQSLDMETLIWTVERRRLDPDSPVLGGRFAQLAEKVRSTIDASQDMELYSALQTAFSLASWHVSPALNALATATLQSRDLIWRLGPQMLLPPSALSARAAAAMAEYAADPTLTDRSRRNGVVHALVESTLDVAVVPALLSLLSHLPLLRWRGPKIAESLRARGAGAQALRILKTKLWPDETPSIDWNDRLIEAGMAIDSESVFAWLDERYRSGSCPTDGVQRLGVEWEWSGVREAWRP